MMAAQQTAHVAMQQQQYPSNAAVAMAAGHAGAQPPAHLHSQTADGADPRDQVPPCVEDLERTPRTEALYKDLGETVAAELLDLNLEARSLNHRMKTHVSGAHRESSPIPPLFSAHCDIYYRSNTLAVAVLHHAVTNTTL
jgi:hypothetical protein